MDLLSPESLGGAGVTLGGLLIITILRITAKFGAFLDTSSEWLRARTTFMERSIKHMESEEDHHSRVEHLLASIDLVGRGVPRAVSGEHTPVPMNLPPRP